MFDAEATRRIVSEECERVVGDAEYDASDARRVAEEVTTGVIERVAEHHWGAYKVIAHCTYMRDGPRTFDVFTVNMWDVPQDGMIVQEYTNGSAKCIVCVWGLKCVS